ncbi:uncharacterized protein UHOD_05751 [Ustilago sp. UG-2017b]|nr:uncharacterized protein UHOD_05751 [Ustilago sp. UG-2017b]
MTQLEPLADVLAATSLRGDNAPDASSEPTTANLAKASFASALRAGQNATPSVVPKVVIPSTASPPPEPPPEPSPEPSTSAAPLVQVDDTILQAMRKRDDRIFFSQYENQMSAFVREPTRTSLELGSMNAYQRLLIHRCADQFQLEHHLDRATHCITLSKTPATLHPSALLSIRAREQIVQRDGIDPVNVHPAIASLASTDSAQSGASSPSPSASASSPSSPAMTPASFASSAAGTPKGAFKIMRRDPSNSRPSRFRSADNDMSDSEKAAAKARKDMTLEEREASYKAARARIFGDLAAISGSTSPTDSSTQLDQTKESDLVKDVAKASPSSSAASSPVASIAGGGRSGKNKKVPSSGSSVASQDGSTQRTRASGSRKGGASQAGDGLNDDLEFSRALPVANAFGGVQQSSPLALPGHMMQGYFPASQLQQSHSNPNLRSRAPVFHPQGSTTTSYAQGGALRYPDMGVQPAQAEMDAFPALSSTTAGPNMNGVNGNQQQRNTSGGAWNRSQTGQEHLMKGVNLWAQQTSNYVQGGRLPQQSQPPPFYPQQPYQMPRSSLTPHYTTPQQPYAGPRSANSSRASSQRNTHQGRGQTRDDAVSVSSISSAASSRSASFSGSVAGSSTNQGLAHGNGSGGGKVGSPAPALSHPSLPARPTWLAPR